MKEQAKNLICSSPVHKYLACFLLFVQLSDNNQHCHRLMFVLLRLIIVVWFSKPWIIVQSD